MTNAKLRIGTSGWTYRHWRETFYPQRFPARRWLEYYAERFNTVEVNATFYGLPAESTFDQWKQRVPDGFLYAVKASRLITHNKKLLNAEDALGILLQRARRLGSRLGPVLYQLPPGMDCDFDRLRAFIELLPRDLTHVFEFRNPTWYVEPVRELLATTGMAFCIHDMHGDESPFWVTAPTAYIRFHGPTEHKYSGSYSDEQLAAWARRIRDLTSSHHTVFAYFNNDIGGHAVRNAETLRGLINN